MDNGEEKLGALFNRVGLPTIVCRMEENLPVLFLNSAARMLFAPALTPDSLHEPEAVGLDAVLRFAGRGQYRAFATALLRQGSAECPDARILGDGRDGLRVRIYAGEVAADGDRLAAVYAVPLPEGGERGEEAFFTDLLNASHQINDVDEAIQTILEMAGEHAGVSRAYIFENVGPNAISNTYEWCAPGVGSVKEDMRLIAPLDFDYPATVEASSMAVTENTDTLSARDREILRRQGVKALAVLPLVHGQPPLGHIGFDDCVANRRWSHGDMRILRDAAGIAASLIHRRNAEREAARSLEIVQTVTDNLDDLVYVTDLDSYELKFISKSLARAVGRSQDEIYGKRCWEVLHLDQTGICPFCPVPKLRERLAAGEPGNYVWELHNNVTGKWYMVKDSIVSWTDGKNAHLGTFVDITYRKQYEEQLKHFAATDAMTDVYNRKWGYGKLEELYTLPTDKRPALTLCFVDLDGLKSVNDRLGHAAGDEMIIGVIQCILSCTRREDFICRWGGDEFLLALHCKLDDARRVMEKINFAIEHYNATRGKDYLLSISYGLVDFNTPAASLDELIAEADRRMYANKMAKRGGSKIFPR